QNANFPPLTRLDGLVIVQDTDRGTPWRARRSRGDPAKSWSFDCPERRIASVAKERVERDEEDLVRLYLTDIGQYPLLTKDDEVRLAQAIEGGNAARCELEKGSSISASKKRELRRSVTEGEQAQRTFV